MSALAHLARAARGGMMMRTTATATPALRWSGARTMASGARAEPTSSTKRTEKPGFKPGDAAPSVLDAVVKFTLVDENNERFEVAGLVGETLPEAAERCGFEDLENDTTARGVPMTRKVTDLWTEDIFGDGISSFQTHVLVPPKYQHLMQPITPDEEFLLEKMDHLGRGPRVPESRIAANIYLTKEMEGIEIYVPDPYPCDVP